MRVYIPFDDGSVVSYDGKKFTVYKQPVAIDANLRVLKEGMAERIWRERRGDLVRALESAWRKECERIRDKKTKRVYSREEIQ
jgi:hypothetical protein